MAATSRVWTIDDLENLPDDGNRYEVVRGELFVTPAPAPIHEYVLARLGRMLDDYVEGSGLGYVYRGRSALQFDGSHTEPDLVVRASIDPRLPWAAAPTPALVVEILSPASRRWDREQKRAYYLDAGVAEYWIVDPKAGAITAVRPGRDDVTVRDTLTWSPHGTQPPFVLDVARLFEVQT